VNKAMRSLSAMRSHGKNTTMAQLRYDRARNALDRADAEHLHQASVEAVNSHTTQQTDRVVEIVEREGAATRASSSNDFRAFVTGNFELGASTTRDERVNANMTRMQLMRNEINTMRSENKRLRAESRAEAKANPRPKAKAKAHAQPHASS
jgi:hypothetical protein